MMGRYSMIVFIGVIAGLIGPAMLYGQTSSLGGRQRQAKVDRVQPLPTRETPTVKRNLTYDRYSWISQPARKPKSFKIGDLVTVVIRERRNFEAESELNARQRLNLKSQLDAFANLTRGGVGAAKFRRGKPTVDYEFQNRMRSDVDTLRTDSFTTRITAQIIDVKPNGVLVLEATARIAHDDETSEITLTGSCRKEDITADNTVLSTQLADKTVVVNNGGALRSVITRGWILRLLDWLKPV